MKQNRRSFLEENRRQAAMLLGAFVLGAAATAALFFVVQSSPRPTLKALRESDLTGSNNGYAFIDPLVGLQGTTNSQAYNSLNADILKYIDNQKNQGILAVSVAFRDINAPGGFTINPDERYTPASLNKVPVMMAYYKLAESDSSILSDRIVYVGSTDSDTVEEIQSVMQLRPGMIYTTEQLIEHMIQYSDNNAAELLLKHLSDTGHLDMYHSVYSDLGVDQNVYEQYTDTITAGEYLIFLRTLYNATYLNRDDSERALQLLSKTDFSEGIESGVPNDVSVAEKFGEVRMTDAEGDLLGKQLNNCGIVYYPGHPYLLCVMTKESGDNIPLLENTVASISRTIYKRMQILYP